MLVIKEMQTFKKSDPIKLLIKTKIANVSKAVVNMEFIRIPGMRMRILMLGMRIGANLLAIIMNQEPKNVYNLGLTDPTSKNLSKGIN